MEAKFKPIILLLLCFATVSLSQSDYDYSCVFTVFVRTSKTFHAGTDSKISVAFYDETGDGILIKDLEAWGGAMEEGHDYFERGNLDIFTGRVPCLSRPVCAMELTSDGSGKSSDWYCNYVELTTTGPATHCNQTLFTVEQWLALDRSPNKLTAAVDNCAYDAGVNPRRVSHLVPVETLLAVV